MDKTSLGMYLREIDNYKLLSANEEKDLAMRIKKGDAVARQKLIESNLRLVVSIAKHYKGTALTFQDLIQEGNLGLMHAVDKFDPDLGYRFSTYATWWIKQAITRAISDKGKTIRTPAHIVDKILKVKKVERELMVKTGREITSSDIAEETGFTVKQVELLKSYTQEVASLDVPVDDDEETTMGALIEDTSIMGPAESYERTELKEVIDQALSTLTEREQGILRRRYGLGYDEPWTLEEVGQVYNLTKERIRQLEKEALRKLRMGESGKNLHLYA